MTARAPYDMAAIKLGALMVGLGACRRIGGGCRTRGRHNRHAACRMEALTAGWPGRHNRHEA